MTRYILGRLLWMPILFLTISLITFGLGFYGPGDPVQQRLGQRANPEVVARLRAEMGLDRPFLVQWLDYVSKVTRGDFGESYNYQGTPVSDLIFTKLGISLQLNVAALLVGAVLGIPIGIFSAFLRRSFADYLLMAAVVAAVSIPTFALAPILMWLFIQQIPVFRIGWDGLFSFKAVLPIFILMLGPMAVFARQTRANLGEVLDADYIRTARGKGLSELTILTVHALRNAAIPLLTIAGLMLAGLIGGSFIIETLFGIPGIGRLGIESFYARDYPIIMALNLMVAFTYAFANLLVDLLYAVVDPRIRVAE